MSAVFRLTLRQLTGRWRLAIMTVLAVLPVLFTRIMTGASSAPWVGEFEDVVLGGMLAGAIAPLIMVAIATVAFGNEVEDRTLANLTLTPLSRWQIVLPKLAATVAVSAPFIVGCAFFTSLLAYNRDWTAVFAVTASTCAGILMYAAVFLWLGLTVKYAIGAGLLYIVLWEGFFSGYVSGIRFLSIRHYAIALMNGLDPRRFVGDPHVGLVGALTVSVGVVALFGWLTTRRLRRMDVP
ncbi:MAG TPA: ABC transporter permease [Longimicrobiales bacterium]|nr:ABC transporter permease [Longimicrobiales bacterium]